MRWTIPNIVGYSWCFGYVAALNILTLIVLSILISCGKFGNNAAAEDEALGKKVESDDLLSSKGSSNAFSEDMPMGEIHEISERDSDDEGTEVGSFKPESLG